MQRGPVRRVHELGGSIGVQATGDRGGDVERRRRQVIFGTKVVVEKRVHQLVNVVPLVDALRRVIVSDVAEEELDGIRGIVRADLLVDLQRLQRGEERIGEALHPEDRNYAVERNLDRRLEEAELVDAVG